VRRLRQGVVERLDAKVRGDVKVQILRDLTVELVVAPRVGSDPAVWNA